ncbi:MAG: hypothetical protein IPM57_08695 [Oligoflexia bacterium]|nr:hypothetical protein [Oligoflexia bacterium]
MQNKEYQEFLESNAQVPEELTQAVHKGIATLINPSPWMTFAKLFGIHMVVGVLSLAVCHQFGVNPFGTKYSLSDWFMNMGGHEFCMAACGFFFFAGSILAAGYIFTIEELRTLKKNELVQTLSLAVISLGLLAAIGAKLALGITLLWVLGGLVGGFLATQTVWKLKEIRIF